jgi:hypothetical protein
MHLRPAADVFHYDQHADQQDTSNKDTKQGSLQGGCSMDINRPVDSHLEVEPCFMSLLMVSTF